MTNSEFEAIYESYAADVWRVCIMFFGASKADAEDAMQTSFVKLLTSSVPFADQNHVKGWLIVTAGNVCKDMLRKKHRRCENVSLDALAEVGYTPKSDSGLMQKVLSLPDKYKTAVYLHYYEGYTGEQIAHLMKTSKSNVFWYLHEGRKRLKELIESED